MININIDPVFSLYLIRNDYILLSPVISCNRTIFFVIVIAIFIAVSDYIPKVVY